MFSKISLFTLTLILSSTLLRCQKSEDFEKAIVQKCDCNPSEVYVNNKCQSDDRLPNTDFRFQLSDEKFTCGYGLEELKVNQGNFEILLNGSVIVQFSIYEHTNDLFCQEDTLNDRNEIVSYIKICPDWPMLRRCCSDPEPENYPTDSNSSAVVRPFVTCTNSSDIERIKNSEVIVDQVSVLMGESDMTTDIFQCPEDYELIQSDINREPANPHLTFNTQGINLVWASSIGYKEQINYDQFCVGGDSGETKAYFCYKDREKSHNESCAGKSCIRKCCGPDKIVSKKDSCELFGGQIDWKPTIKIEEGEDSEAIESSLTTVYGFPLCESYIEENNATYLDPSGKLRIAGINWIDLSATEYCVDAFEEDDDTIYKSALTCAPAIEKSCYWNKKLTYICFFISVISIICTLFVYLSVTEIRQWLLSKCVISESFAILFFFISMINMRNMLMNEGNPSGFCIVTGISTYYFILANFFWMNVMSFDIFSTIKSIITLDLSEQSKNSRFLVYSLYAWGVPLIFVIAAISVDSTDALDYPHIIRPNFFKSCFFPKDDYVARWIFLFGPILIILVANLVIFTLVVVMLIRYKELAILLQNNTTADVQKKMNYGKENAKLCCKFFVVLGMTWIMEIVSFAVGSSHCYAWLFSDIINSLNGLFMFIIFVCKKDIIKRFVAIWRVRLGLTTEEAKDPSSAGPTQKNFRNSLSFFSTVFGGVKKKKKKPARNSKDNPELKGIQTYSRTDE